MRHISILVLKEAILSSIDAPMQLFTKVNEVLASQGRPPVFKVELVGGTREVLLNKGSCSIRCDHTIEEVRSTDLIVIPLVCNGFPQAIEANKALAPWVIHQYKQNAEIVCLCTGAFFLASTGLLNDKSCAVHWAVANEFKKMFPGVSVKDNKIITHEQGIYTSGGQYSYLNLLVLMIEKYAGREMAILFSKMFEIEIERKSQAPYAIFVGQKEHDDELVRRAQEFIEGNYQEKISIDQLSDMAAINRRSFERRFKKATSNTIVEYTQRVKIEAVKKGLESSRKTVNDLMYEVGYADVKAFRTIFRKYTGLSPAAYRSKYLVIQE